MLECFSHQWAIVGKYKNFRLNCSVLRSKIHHCSVQLLTELWTKNLRISPMFKPCLEYSTVQIDSVPSKNRCAISLLELRTSMRAYRGINIYYHRPSTGSCLRNKQPWFEPRPYTHPSFSPSRSGTRCRLFPRLTLFSEERTAGGHPILGMIYIGPRGFVHAVCSTERRIFRDGPMEHLFI